MNIRGLCKKLENCRY